MMQILWRYYVQYFNYCYCRTGTLWEGRYKAALVDTEPYLLTCMRYIELNPVRAQMVSHPAEYPWSSYRSNALGKREVLVEPHSEYRRLGTPEQERQSTYRQLFRVHIDEKTLGEIRQAANEFWEMIASGIACKRHWVPPGRIVRTRLRPEIGKLSADPLIPL